MCTIFPRSVDQDLLFYEYTPSSSKSFSNFFSRFAKNKKEIQNESYRGHCLQRKKKGSSDITKKKQNRLFAKKKKISPIDLKNKNYVDLNSNPPTEALLKCISIIKCIKLVG